jgi:hypothetical protein
MILVPICNLYEFPPWRLSELSYHSAIIAKPLVYKRPLQYKTDPEKAQDDASSIQKTRFVQYLRSEAVPERTR